MQRDAGPSKGTKRPAAPAGLLAIVEAFETATRSAPIGQGGGGVHASSMPEEEKASAKSGRQTHSPAPAPPVLLPGQAATAAQLTSVELSAAEKTGVRGALQASQAPPGELRSAPATSQGISRQASSSPVDASTCGTCASSQTQLEEKLEPVHCQSEKGATHELSGGRAHA